MRERAARGDSADGRGDGTCGEGEGAPESKLSRATTRGEGSFGGLPGPACPTSDRTSSGMPPTGARAARGSYAKRAASVGAITASAGAGAAPAPDLCVSEFGSAIAASRRGWTAPAGPPVCPPSTPRAGEARAARRRRSALARCARPALSSASAGTAPRHWPAPSEDANASGRRSRRAAVPASLLASGIGRSGAAGTEAPSGRSWLVRGGSGRLSSAREPRGRGGTSAGGLHAPGRLRSHRQRARCSRTESGGVSE